jgi:hypothetical protein
MNRPHAATIYPRIDKKRQSFVQPKVASLWVARRGRDAMLGTIASSKGEPLPEGVMVLRFTVN